MTDETMARPMLLGSSLLPSMIDIHGKEVQLGDVVRGAVADSELTADEWNQLSSLDREALLARRIYKMRGNDGGCSPVISNDLATQLHYCEEDLQAHLNGSDPNKTDTCEAYFVARGRQHAFAESIRIIRSTRNRLTRTR